MLVALGTLRPGLEWRLGWLDGLELELPHLLLFRGGGDLGVQHVLFDHLLEWLHCILLFGLLWLPLLALLPGCVLAAGMLLVLHAVRLAFDLFEALG